MKRTPSLNRATNAPLIAAARAHVLAYLARNHGDREALRDDLSARCRGTRYVDVAIYELARDGLIESVARKWQLPGRAAA